MYSGIQSLVLLSILPSLLHAQEICCPGAACYPLGSPWSTLLRLAPPPQCINQPVKYLYSNRSNPNYPVVFSPFNVSEIKQYYDARKPTVIVFHGWMGCENSSEVRNITAVYLKRVDANAIFVDFAKIALDLNYAQAASNIRVAATYVIRMVKLLLSLGTSPSQIHLIGFSLGAQLASYVAKAIPGIGRLTGLDPAGPYFTNQSCEVRLCKDDAIFTEAIHTNGDPVTGLGTNDEDADVNFWVNGGWEQPKCGITGNPSLVPALINITSVDGLMIQLACSHFRSPLIYAESLASTCTFWGVAANESNIWISRLTLGYLTKYIVNTQNCKLENCVPIGLETINATGRGSFVVATNYESPFCVSRS